MPIHEIILGEEGVDTNAVELLVDSDTLKAITVPYSGLSGSRAEQETIIVNTLQVALDAVLNKNSFPSEDPDRNTDPDLETAFWSGGPNITYRSIIVIVAPWNAIQSRFDVAIHRANPVAN